METLSMCRICLAEDVRLLNIVNSYLQETYEILIGVPFETKDRRPSQVCYICCARLEACYQLRVTCLQTEQLFNQMIENNKSKPQLLLNVNRLQIEHPINLSIAPETSDNDDIIISYNNIKKEPLDPIEDVQVKEEYVEEDVNRENTDLVQSTCANSSNNATSGVIRSEMIQGEVSNVTEHDSDWMHSNVCHITVKIESDDTSMCTPVKLLKLTGPKKKPPGTSPHKNKTVSKLQNKKVIKKLQSVQQTKTDNQIVECSNTDVYKCDICEKSFNRKHHLRCHNRVHAGEKPFKCNVCQKCFRKTNDLAKHIYIHSGEPPFKCIICGICFDEKQTLNEHICRHVGEKRYKCKKCEKSFGSTSHLSRHNRTHFGVKLYKCDVCDKSFAAKQNLSNHIRIHTGDRPFKCDICTKSFRNKSDLTKHTRIHTGEKPYICETCKKCFRSSSDLTKHTRIHTGDKPYKCDICEKCFTDKRHLAIHIRVHTFK